MHDLTEAPISERFEHLLRIISSEPFLKMEGLGNEIPFFICAYEASEAVEMERVAEQLQQQLANKGIQALLVNLYDLSVEIVQARGIWEEMLEIEASTPKDKFFELLQNVLDTEHYLIPAIAQRLAEKDYDVLFITGVGAVFPYIRSHNVLNNLQSTAKHLPTVLFFPGEYRYTSIEGSSLNLFGRLHDDNYYRAFNIFQYQL